MDACEVKQYKIYPYLFVEEKIIVITWVGGFLIYSPKDELINEMIEWFKIKVVDLNQEVNDNRLLCVNIVS